MTLNCIILIKLLFAHFLADFCFQSKRLVEKKREGKQGYHVLHACINALTAYLLVGQWKLWYIPLAIALSHYAIDLWKSRVNESVKNFIADQLLHLSVLVILWLAITGQFGNLGDVVEEISGNQTFWIYLTGFVFILKPTSIILAVSTKKWEDGRGDNGLKDAGQWIGYLERTLVLIFMCLSIYEAIGFILAAKSIFRFGELKESSDIKKTEYIMIGTFLSFTIAVITGLLIK